MDCVSGKTSESYDRCEDHNADENCKKFEMDANKKIKRNLIFALHEYNQKLYACDQIGAYINELIQGLEFGNSMKELCYFSKEDRLRKYKCKKYDD